MKAKTTATDPVHIQYITQDRPGSFGSTDSYVWPFCAVKEHHHELELIEKIDAACEQRDHIGFLRLKRPAQWPLGAWLPHA